MACILVLNLIAYTTQDLIPCDHAIFFLVRFAINTDVMIFMDCLSLTSKL